MHQAVRRASADTSAHGKRTQALYAQAREEVYRRTDKMFAWLMVLQWLGGIVAAWWISPRTWSGSQSEVHVHVWAAIFLGAAINGLPIFLAWKRPGHWLTRQSIALSQILTSALLIHLTGGRIETHFHVFGSLAFLAFYRDWRVLATATVVVAVDHLVRGLFWPQSVFGVLTASNWRWLEHAAWVLFEDTFLLISIKQSLRDQYDVAMRRAKLEDLQAQTERKVIERTSELMAAHRQLLESSRRAGMAEVATNVLHNVGNVLNSVNVSAETLGSQVRQLKAGNFKRIADLLRQHEGKLPEFLGSDPRGRELPDYMVKLAENLAQPQAAILDEIDSLRNNIHHIKEIVNMQQSIARKSSVIEAVSPVELMEQAVGINGPALARHGVRLVREYDTVPEIETDRHQVLQILVNLLSNANHALESCPSEKRIVLRATVEGSRQVKLSVLDNGCGIAPENLNRIFEHGFTTREQGHGFGLHSGALTAGGLGGTLTAHSEGAGKGALFTLSLPLGTDLKQ